MKKKTILTIVFATILFILLSSNVFASGGVVGNVVNNIPGAVEKGGEMLRSAGNSIADGAQTVGDYARDVGNGIVNGTDRAIDSVTDNQTLTNGVRPTGEGAKNQTQTMTTDNTLSNNRNNLSSREFLGIKFSVWMWIILIIVIIVIIALICKYMKEHDDDDNNKIDEE